MYDQIIISSDAQRNMCSGAYNPPTTFVTCGAGTVAWPIEPPMWGHREYNRMVELWLDAREENVQLRQELAALKGKS